MPLATDSLAPFGVGFRGELGPTPKHKGETECPPRGEPSLQAPGLGWFNARGILYLAVYNRSLASSSTFPLFLTLNYLPFENHTSTTCSLHNSLRRVNHYTSLTHYHHPHTTSQCLALSLVPPPRPPPLLAWVTTRASASPSRPAASPGNALCKTALPSTSLPLRFFIQLSRSLTTPIASAPRPPAPTPLTRSTPRLPPAPKTLHRQVAWRSNGPALRIDNVALDHA